MLTDFWKDAFSYEILHAPILACLFAAIACGAIGSIITVKRMTYIAAAIAHCVLGGMGLAKYLKVVHDMSFLTPRMGALAAAVLAALIIWAVTLYGKQRTDTVMGVIWALGMASGISFIMVTPGYNEDLTSYLFGDILMVSWDDVKMMILLDAVIVGTLLLFYRRFLTMLFCEDFARLRSVSVAFYYLLLLLLIALSVVLLIQVVGIVMVIALMTLPAATAGCFTKRLHYLILAAVLFCLFYTLAGLTLSYKPNLPVGPTIIEFAGISYLLVLSGKYLFHRFFHNEHHHSAAK